MTTTTTSYRGKLGVDLHHLDGLVKDVAHKDRVALDIFGRVGSGADPDDVLLEAGGRSVPDSVAFFAIFWRSFRTLGPIVIADLLALALAAFFAHGLLTMFFGAQEAAVLRLAPVTLIPLFVAYWIAGLYSQIWAHPAIELRQLTHVTTVVLLAAMAGGLVTLSFSLWCAAAWPAVVTLVPLLRNVARRLCARRQWWGYPTLVIGTGAGADAMARALLRDNNSGLRPVLLTDPKGECRTSILPVVNDAQSLESILRTATIRHAVISLPHLSAARLGETLDRYSGIVPHILVLSDHSTLPTLWSTSRGCGRRNGIEVRNGLMVWTLQLVKRAIDLAIAIMALCLGFPLLAAVALMIRCSSPGPIFFAHSRIGRHGRRFKAWKFRTMKVNSEAVLRDYLAQHPEAQAEWDRDHKLRDDPRVTKFGRFARKTSLDELPQLWNVLIGDMSLVGPRPIVDEEVVRYGQTFRLYASVKPGITGMWQVSGRNDISYDERVLLDQFYIRHWSPWLDIYILAKTVVALLHRDGAY